VLEELAQLHQIGVGDVGQGAELALEAYERVRRGAQERVQRDPGALLAIQRLVDQAHAALSEAADDLEALGALEVSLTGLQGAWYHARYFTSAKVPPRSSNTW
jgi:hypothetical protein